MAKIICYTDGACSGNPGIGGWGWTATMTIGHFTVNLSDYNGMQKTTNQQMELQALANFLEWCPKNCDVEIHSDSVYVLSALIGTINIEKGANNTPLVNLNAFSKGYMKNWVTKEAILNAPNSTSYWQKERPNTDEWYRIHQRLLYLGENTKFAWVRGHSNNIGNDKADTLAKKYIKTHKK